MAKVLKDETIGWTKEMTCKECSSKILFGAADVYRETMCYFDESNTYYRVVCPACRMTIDLTKGQQLPEWVKQQAKKSDAASQKETKRDAQS